MQPPTPPAAAPPAPPAPPTIVGPPIAIDGVQPTIIEGLVPGDRLTERQKELIEDRRSDMSDQITSASARRDEAAAQLRTATGADREGLERRLRLLDDRIVQLEADLAYTGRLLYAEPVGGGGTMMPPPNFPGREGPNETAIGVVFMLFVMFPIALAFARLLWRRATGQAVARPSLESTQRLERVEQAIDSIAVEVERISEGQRFVTRILTEGSAQSVLNAGRGEQGATQRREGVKVPRGQE